MPSENDNKLVNLSDLKEAYDNSKHIQTEVSSPSASGTAVAFIDSISQNTNGVISPTKKTVAGATQSAAGLMSALDKTKLDGIASGAQVNSLTGVKGNAESTYRTGNVNITPANIGVLRTGDLDNVNLDTILYNFLGTVWNITGTGVSVFGSTCGTLICTDTDPFGTSGTRLQQIFMDFFYNGIWIRKRNETTWSEWTCLRQNNGAVPVTAGGTGATTPAAARTNLEITPANIGAKATQSAVSEPTASGTAVAFIDNISQNTNGVISPTKKTVRSASQSENGLMSATDKAKLDGIAAGAQVNSLTGVKGNAESTYRTGNVNITPANIGAVAINESVKMTNQNADLTKTNNNISADAWMPPICWTDKNLKEYAVVQGVVRSNGRTTLYIGVRNFNANGNIVTNKGIYLDADKDGNLIYTFADPQNARSALGITPENIGAVKDGGAVSTADLNENSIRYLGADSSNSGVSHGTLLTMTNGNDRRSQLFIQSSDTSAPVKIRTYYNGWQSWHTVYKDNTIVPVTAGGTGATTPAAARTNLEITPANIGAVAKTGDTMTGSLTLNTGTFTSISKQPQVNLKNNTYVSGQNPSEALWNVAANSFDKNGQRAGVIHQVFTTDGNSTWVMELQKYVNGTNYYAGFQILGSMTSVSENKLKYNVDSKALTGGKWQGDAIGTQYGGTGATNADAARQNLLTLKTGYYYRINPNTIKHNFIGHVWDITEQPSKIGACGTLEVMSDVPFADTGIRVRQVFYNYFAEEVWTRKWDGSTWSEWTETYFGASISFMSTDPTISSLYNELSKLTLNYPVNIRINNDTIQSLTGKSISGGYGTVVKTGVESGTLVLSFDICYVAGNYRHVFTTRVSQTTITPGTVYRYTSTTVD